jgi:hypothetical protein
MILSLGGPYSRPRCLGEEENISISAANYTIALITILQSVKLSSVHFVVANVQLECEVGLLFALCTTLCSVDTVSKLVKNLFFFT